MPEPLTLAQIEREPEKWEYQIRTRYGKGWWERLHTLRFQTGLGVFQRRLAYLRQEAVPQAHYAMFARPIGSKGPFRKVEE